MMSSVSNPLPRGRFGVILADPPWRFETYSVAGRDRCPDAPVTRNEQRRNTPVRHYETMPIEQLMALPVGEIGAPDCVLLMWAVDSMLPQALALGYSWGFEFKTVGFYWVKLRREGSLRAKLFEALVHKLFPMGTGYWTRANPEQCLLFTRGSPQRLSRSVRKLIIAERREHSRKPDEQYPAIEQLLDGPYLELFARNERPGWTWWGNQTGRFEVAA